MAKITTLKDKNNNTLYPQTKTNAVLDNNNTDVGTLISNEATARQNADTNLQNQINNKVDKTSTANQVYVTDSNGNQSTLLYSDVGANYAIARRNNFAELNANGFLSHNTKKYYKQFWNNNGDYRYCHIGILRASWSNNIFAGRIYTHRGYGAGDGNQQIVDFNVTIQNDQTLRGYATTTFNNNSGQNVVLYFVKTSNDWEWEVYLRMNNWSSAIIDFDLSTGDGNDNFLFIFDTSPSNLSTSAPSNPALTITPKIFFSAKDYVGITGNSGVSYYADSPTFVIVYFNNNMGGIADSSGLSIDVSSNNSTWYELIRTSSVNAYPKFECISAYVPAGEYFRYNVWGDRGHYEAKYIKG